MIHARPDYQNIQDNDTPIERDPIPDNEPVFLLRAQDRHAAATVRYWASLVGGADGMRNAVTKSAMEHADLMDAWPKKKQPGAPVSEGLLDEELLDYAKIIKNTLCTQEGVKFMGKEAPEGLYTFEIVSVPVPFVDHYAEALVEVLDMVLAYINEVKDRGAVEVTAYLWDGWPFNPMHGHRQINVHLGILGRTEAGDYLTVGRNGGDIEPFHLDARRYEVTIREVNPPPGSPAMEPATLRYDEMEIHQERGIQRTYKAGSFAPSDLSGNGEERCQIRLWTGCRSFESFEGEKAVLQLPEPLLATDVRLLPEALAHGEVYRRALRENEPRNLKTVLDEILKLVPELEPLFAWLKNHIAYQPPEVMASCWSLAAAILDTRLPTSDPRHGEVLRVFQGHE